jgi:hypothetical protein
VRLLPWPCGSALIEQSFCFQSLDKDGTMPKIVEHKVLDLLVPAQEEDSSQVEELEYTLDGR